MASVFGINFFLLDLIIEFDYLFFFLFFVKTRFYYSEKIFSKKYKFQLPEIPLLIFRKIPIQKKKISVAGNSAGASAVAYLAASPGVPADLFQVGGSTKQHLFLFEKFHF